MMEVLILNGSPRGSRSVTGKLLESLTTGLTEGGASVTLFSVAQMKIAPCNACLSCMHRTPGVCAQKDDMEPVYERLKVSDLLVIGTPVYTDNMTAQMKIVMDRFICAMQPFLIRDQKGRVRHPFWWRLPGKFLLVSTSGFPEKKTFEPLIATFRAQAANAGSEPLGEICVPGSIALQMEPSKMVHHLERLFQMGKIIAETGNIDRTILDDLNTPAFATAEYLIVAAAYESWCREKLGIPKP
jgi:multimeric flavodoxin WrbA